MTDKPHKDREKTKERIVNAIHELLVQDGCQALGINRIAKQAGVDKVLIYRYFDGLSGALRAYAESDLCWPSTAELIGGSLDAFDRMDKHQIRKSVMKNTLRALRARPHAASLLAWELVSTNELIEVMRELRAERIGEIMQVARDTHDGPLHSPIGAVDLLLSSAVHYLAMADSDNNSRFGVLQTASGIGWEDIDKAIDHICDALAFYDHHHDRPGQ